MSIKMQKRVPLGEIKSLKVEERSNVAEGVSPGTRHYIAQF